MDIKILDYIPDSKGMKVGYVDFSVTYNLEKSETFRNVGHFKKENKEWLGMPNCKRKDKWVPMYERTPNTRTLLTDALKVLNDYLTSNPPTTFEQEIGW